MGWDDRWFYIEHTFEREGRLMAVGLARCCFRGRDGTVPPALAFAAVGSEDADARVPEYVAPWRAAEEGLLEAVEALPPGGPRGPSG